MSKCASQLENGESAWIVPWNINVDIHGRMYVCPDATTYKNIGGTSNVLIKRVEDGFEADLTRCDHYYIATSERGIPIVKVIDS
jgi:hypothetical protein